MLAADNASNSHDSADQYVVRLSDLSKSFDDRYLLKGLNFELETGQHVTILGPGGCGKSTILKMMLGLVKPDSGRVEVLGKDIVGLSRTEKREVLQNIGMAFQLGALFDFMTVRENILFALENMIETPALDREETIIRFLESVNLPTASGKLPSELSGGMRRRVGIVRALITKPKLALLDEPTAGLDPVTSTIVIDMIHRMAKQTDSSMICVTSSVEVAFTFSKVVAILKDGSIIGKGTWEELHALNDPWIHHFLDVRGFTPPVDSPEPE
jgi:phospholipid/cholesterol/gamma-HCH transport system ATP-binding protein